MEGKEWDRKGRESVDGNWGKGEEKERGEGRGCELGLSLQT